MSFAMDTTLQQYHAVKLAQAQLQVVLGDDEFHGPGGLALVTELLRLAERDPPLPEARLREIYRGLSYDYAQAEADLAPRVDALRASVAALQRRAQTHGQCAICLEEDVVLVFALGPVKTESFQHATCHHRFCHPCLVQYVRTAVDAQRWVVPCPSSNCARRLTETDIARLCEADAKRLAQRRGHLTAKHCGLSDEDLLRMPYYATCKRCDVENEATLSVAQAVREGMATGGYFTRGATCCSAQVLFHSSDSQGIHPCPGCGALTSRYKGCGTIACPCGTTFMWGSWHVVESHSQFATAEQLDDVPVVPAPDSWQAFEQALEQAADVSSVRRQRWAVARAEIHTTRPIANAAIVQAMVVEAATLLAAAMDLPALCKSLVDLTTDMRATGVEQDNMAKVDLAMGNVLSTVGGRHVLLVNHRMMADSTPVPARIEAAVRRKAGSVMLGSMHDLAADGTLVVWVLEGARGIMVATTPGGPSTSWHRVVADLEFHLCCEWQMAGHFGATEWMVV